MAKFFIDQHGCAKNQVDGELIVSRLIKLGMEQTFDPSLASIIVINTCGFIKSAKEESFDAVFACRSNYPDAKIILAGCLAERYASTLEEGLPEVDAILGNGNLDKIDTIIEELRQGRRPVIKEPQEGVCCGDRSVLLGYKGSTFVKITEGCSNHCSFCAIPLIRGEVRSRPSEAIINEIKDLLSKGILEFNLIGQDLAAYGTGLTDNCFGDGRTSLPTHKDGINMGTQEPSGLARLLKNISSIEGSFVVRLLYIHPDHFNRDILPIMQKDNRIIPYFDIPFQSGSDAVIKAMNRIGSQEEYIRLIKDIREALPGLTLRTTFLTGFPGETEEDALNTQNFLKAIKPDWSGCFPYSKEEDTPAYNFKHKVSSKLAKARASNLESIQKSLTHESLEHRIGEEIEVLIEEVVKGDDGIAIGRALFQAPEVDGSVVVRYDIDDVSQCKAVQTGRFVRAKVVSAPDVDLDAIFVSDSRFNNDKPESGLSFAEEMID